MARKQRVSKSQVFEPPVLATPQIRDRFRAVVSELITRISNAPLSEPDQFVPGRLRRKDDVDWYFARVCVPWVKQIVDFRSAFDSCFSQIRCVDVSWRDTGLPERGKGYFQELEILDPYLRSKKKLHIGTYWRVRQDDFGANGSRSKNIGHDYALGKNWRSAAKQYEARERAVNALEAWIRWIDVQPILDASKPGSNSTPPEEAQSETERLNRIKQLKPARRNAYLWAVYAEKESGIPLTDRATWDWLHAHKDQNEELNRYDLPPFQTFTRYLTQARTSLGENRKNSRSGRGRGNIANLSQL